MAWTLGASFIERQARAHDWEAGKAWQQELLRIAHQNDVEEELGRAFRSLFRKLGRDRLTAERCQEALDRASHEWKFPFEAVFFDESGEPIPVPGHSLRDPEVVRLAWILFTKGYREGRTAAAKGGIDPWGDRLLDRFGTYFFHPFAMFPHLERTVFPMRFPDRDGWMMWWRYRDRGNSGGMLLVEHPPSFLQLLERWMSRGEFQGSYLQATSGGEKWVASLSSSLPDQVLNEGLKAIESGSAEHLVQGRHLWAVARLGPLTLIGARARSHDPEAIARMVLRALLGFYLLGVLFLFRKGSDFLIHFHIRIKGKIGLLMGFTLLPPLVMLLVLGQQKVRQMEEELALQAEKAAMEALFAIDKGFPTEKSRLLERFRKIRDDVDLRVSSGPALRKAAARMVIRERLIIFEIRDIGNRILWTTNFPYPFLMQMYSSILENGMKRWIPHRLSREKMGTSPSLRTMMMDGNSYEGGSSRRFMNRDQVNEFQFGPLSAYMYTWFFPDPAHPLGAMVLVIHADRVMRRYFERQIAHRFTSGSGQFRFLARYRKTGQWLGRSNLVDRDLEHLAWVARNRGVTTTGLVNISGRRYLGMVLPGGALSEFDLVALFPHEVIVEQIRPWQWILRFLVVFSMFLVVLLSVLLSRQLLTPVGRISRALVEAGERKKNVRVDIDSQDELGELGRLFNETFAKLSELDLARVIQERLFSPPPDREGEFELRARNRFGPHLSGDFFEVLPLGGGKLLLAIGDVAGQGASAALVMAMTKSALRVASQSEHDPSRLLEFLDSLIRNQLQGAHLVTCFLGILDTATGDFSCANAGHPFPLVIARSGACREVGIPHFSLGAGRPRPFSANFDRLESGEILLLCTNGLYQPRSLLEKPLGFSGVTDLLREGRGQPLDRLADMLMTSGATSSRGAEDDTVILLVKNEPIFR